MSVLMVLWLPIVLSAVIVFVASSIMHMLLTYHRSDYNKLPDEDKVRAALRAGNPKPGVYMVPFGTYKEMNSPAMQEKFKEGPVGLLTLAPNGLPGMSKYLIQWFIYCLLIGYFVAYITAHTLPASAHYPAVFRVAGVTGFMAYGLGHLSNSIWRRHPWLSTIKEVIDGLVYGLLTAGTFGWLWPFCHR